MSKLPVIVGGFYRSGTSLVRRLLDSHSAMHCAPEIKFLKDFHGDYYVNDPLRHDRFFHTAPTMGLEKQEILDIFGPSFVKAHEVAANKAHKQRWADKNPENLLYLDDWRKLLPEGFIFLHVIRHPLDVLASLQEAHFDKAMPPSFEFRVKLLKSFADAGAEYEKRYPESSLQIRYEELVGNPEQTLKELFSKLGLAWEPEVFQRFFSPERGTGLEDHKVANTREVHASSVERWKKDLKTSEINMAIDILGDNFYGYKLGSARPKQMRWSQ